MSDYQPMVPRVKTLLVEALRSDFYKQCVARMRVTVHSGPEIIRRNGIGHCCLGVLTEIAVKEGILDEFSINNGGQCPLVKVKNWAGLSEFSQGHLMTMNDGRPVAVGVGEPLKNENRKTFAEIATWIEHNL